MQNKYHATEVDHGPNGLIFSTVLIGLVVVLGATAVAIAHFVIKLW